MKGEWFGLIGALIGSVITLLAARLGWQQTFLDNKKLISEQRLNELRYEMKKQLSEFFRQYYDFLLIVSEKINRFDSEPDPDGSRAEELIQSITKNLVTIPRDLPHDITYICPELEEALDWFDWMNEVFWLQLTSGGAGEELFLNLCVIIKDCREFGYQFHTIASSLLVSLILGVPTKPFHGIDRNVGRKPFKLDLSEDRIVSITKPPHSDNVYSEKIQY